MNLLQVAPGKFVNTDRITYIHAKSKDKVLIQFQSDVSAGGIGIPPSYLEVKGPDAERLLRWLEARAERIEAI